MAITDPCPECGEQLEFDEVDIGVGVQRGNPGCPNCGWSPKRDDELCAPNGTGDGGIDDDA